jgi:hypothetical protein
VVVGKCGALISGSGSYLGNHAPFSREVEIFPPPLEATRRPTRRPPSGVAWSAFACAAALRPVLLWLDDVQWSWRGVGALNIYDPGSGFGAPWSA